MESTNPEQTIDESDSEGEELDEEQMENLRKAARLGGSKDSTGRRKAILSIPVTK